MDETKSVAQPIFSRPEKRKNPSAPWECITAISSLTIAIGGLAALVFAWMQIRQLRNEARVEYLEEYRREFDSPTARSIRKAFVAERLDMKQERLRAFDPDDVPPEVWDELNFCDDLGL